MKIKIKFLFIMVFLLSIISPAHEKQKAEWKGTIEKHNGVTVVKNPKDPIHREDVFSLEEELSIGKKEGKEEYIFSYITDIGVDEEERIYIIDSKESHIKVFNKMGEYIKTIGKKGQGPGEMRRPTSLRITSQNEIVVNDSAARKIHFFTLDGNFIRAVSQTKMTFFSNPKVPLGARPRTWKKGKLYTIEEDEDSYQYVKRYKVAWKY